MKKILFMFSLALLAFAPFASVGAVNLGIDDVHKAGKEAGFKEASETTFAETIGTVVSSALSLIGVIFTALMVYAGYLWMTARGEADQIDQAKKIITGSLIGLVVTLSAYAISNFVVGKVIEKTTAPASQIK